MQSFWRSSDVGRAAGGKHRSWIRQNSERTEFWRIQLRIVVSYASLNGIGPKPDSCALPKQLLEFGRTRRFCEGCVGRAP